VTVRHAFVRFECNADGTRLAYDILNCYEPQSRFARLWLDMTIAQSDAHNFDAALNNNGLQPVGPRSVEAFQRTDVDSTDYARRAARGLFNGLTTALAPRVHQFANCHRASPSPQQLQSDVSYIGKLIPLLYAQFPCETGRPTSRVEFNGLTANGC